MTELSMAIFIMAPCYASHSGQHDTWPLSVTPLMIHVPRLADRIRVVAAADK
ncbi:MAG TPA: hypothetical protein VE621_01790 [Bryobacteraceae bacterium]|nr:hypothetical protein [Bryobacteraceae bacterium]